MSTPTEYQILRQRHDRLREGIEALAESWRRGLSVDDVPGYDPLWLMLHDFRALLDQEDA